MKMIGIRIAWILMGVLLLEAGCSSSGSPSSTPTNSRFGTVAVSLGLNPINYIDGPTQAEIADMARMGAHGVRVWVNWREIEPQMGNYVWSKMDRVIADVRSQGMEPWALVAGSPSWACRDPSAQLGPEPDSMCSPKPDDFERFLTSIVSRYKNDVTYWEIWNEPNLEFYWEPRPNAAEYVEIVRMAYAVIPTLDAQAHVVIGSLAGSDLIYMKSLLDGLNRQKLFDGFSSHPYWFSDTSGYPLYGPGVSHTATLADGSNRSVNFREEMLLYKELLEAYDYRDIPLWITEFGWAAHSEEGDERYYVRLSDQARFLEETHQLLISDPQLSFVRGLFWFADGDWATDPADQTAKEEFGFYGLKRVTGEWKPAASSFLRLATQ